MRGLRLNEQQSMSCPGPWCVGRGSGFKYMRAAVHGVRGTASRGGGDPFCGTPRLQAEFSSLLACRLLFGPPRTGWRAGSLRRGPPFHRSGLTELSNISVDLSGERFVRTNQRTSPGENGSATDSGRPGLKGRYHAEWRCQALRTLSVPATSTDRLITTSPQWETAGMSAATGSP